MAWVWVKELKVGSTTYKFAIPPVVYTEGAHTGSPTTLYFGGSTRYDAAAYALGVAALNELASEEYDYEFSSGNPRNIYVYGLNGSAYRIDLTNNFPNSVNSKNYCYLNLSQIGYISRNFSSYDLGTGWINYAHILTLCCCVNTDTQRLFFGVMDARHDQFMYGGNTYKQATFSIYMSDAYLNQNNLWNGFKDCIPTGGGGSDPYEAGGYSDTTPSSSGDFDDDSDSISVPSLPSISAMGAGAVSLAVINEANLRTFMNYILSPSFAGLSNISRFFSDPIKAIACLNYMPYTPTNTSGFTLSWGGDDTGASVGAVSAQYEEIDCGSVDLTEFYGSCLDYSPYTTVQLVLPFAGSVDIDPDEFNGKTISVKYHIDNYTGAGLVLVSDGDRVLLQVPCSVSNPIPLTSTDYSAVISAIANVVMGGVSTIAAVYTGGASVGASVALAGGFAASAAGNVMSAKLHYNHGGSMGMGTGMFGVLKPYLIIKRPRQCLPERNGNFQGYPTFVTENLGDLSGFTKIAEIHLDSIPVTTEERAELLAILKGGVIF